jgi:hypothetical protein
MTTKTKPAVQDAQVVNQEQTIDTEAYVPTYKVLPELKESILRAIGDAPFNQIAGIMNAINVETMDHNTLTQVINVLGNFPYLKVAELLANVNTLVEQIVDEDDD